MPADSPTPPPLGVENYQLGPEISSGGMGSVLEARDGKLDRTVAIKVMLLEANADARMRQRFLREAQVLAKLAHPNIVPIYDIVWEDGLPLFYSMKLVKGRTLQAILTDLRKEVPEALRDFPLTRLLGIFRKVCDAIAFAHSQGVLHRDLKPENIMVGEFGEVLVMDWGLAKLLRSNDEEETHSSFVIRHSPRPKTRLLTRSLARCSAPPNTCPLSKPVAACRTWINSRTSTRWEAFSTPSSLCARRWRERQPLRCSIRSAKEKSPRPRPSNHAPAVVEKLLKKATCSRRSSSTLCRTFAVRVCLQPCPLWP
ncbi:serine/threonine-protein kinase [Prosthecobacter sp.]|uniref:serine/threonine-protein kinase n=1 Tax=Prosthecobacter sp. TaxID=1965333 RepID=UPI00260CD719|nr:serine/threonine-protein kinase [Prosthecobacter sp.]